MKRLLVLQGMKRSGNHALIQWIRANLPVVFFNNAVQVGGILRGERTLPEPLPFNRWLGEQSRIPLLAKARAYNKDVLVSFEDFDPAWRLFSTTPPATLSILILRDPYNLFASRIRKGVSTRSSAFANPPSPNFRYMIELWKAHALAFLNETSGRPDVAVYFNRWFDSPAYRQQIADSLAMPNSDAGLDIVDGFGGGSSFDGLGYDARARQMDVLSRVDELSEDERSFLAIVQEDAEVRALHERIEAATAT